MICVEHKIIFRLRVKKNEITVNPYPANVENMVSS